MRASLSFLLVLGLLGCRSVWDPTFMPAGYSYHDQVYKSAPGPEADDLGYTYSAENNEEILQIWRIVIEDLVNQLEQQTGLSAQPLYVKSLPLQNAFNASYDHVLREELSARGYFLKSVPDGALNLYYEAFLDTEKDWSSAVAYNNDLKQEPEYRKPEQFKDFILVLSAVDGTALKGQIKSLYRLPAYGYAAEPTLNTILKPIVGGWR